MSTLVITIISLCAIGVVSAVILYFVAQKFKVEEDPRIDIVEGLLPGANCGGCGYPGCRGLAEAAVKSETMEGILCPVGGAETMNKVAAALGREVKAQAPKIAVVRCNGTCENRPRTSQYDGVLWMHGNIPQPSNIPYMSAIQPADSAVWDVATVLQPARSMRYTWILRHYCL